MTHTVHTFLCCVTQSQIHFQCPLLLLGASPGMVLDALESDTPNSVDIVHCAGESTADDSGLQGWMYFGVQRCSLPRDTQVNLPLQLITVTTLLVLILSLLSGFIFTAGGLSSILHFLPPFSTFWCQLSSVLRLRKSAQIMLFHLWRGPPSGLEPRAIVHRSSCLGTQWSSIPVRWPRKHSRRLIRVVSMPSCCACALIYVLVSFHSEIPKLMWRQLLLNAWRCWTWWKRSSALSNPYISTGSMTAFSRRNLVEVQILFWYHMTLLSELNALEETFSVQEFTSASTLQSLVTG